MERLHNLFIRHLRVIYDGEKTMAKTFAAMSFVSHSKELERFFITRQVEKENLVKTLTRIFALLHVSPTGEQDDVIRAFTDRPVNDEAENIRTAEELLGKSMNIYLVNGYKTAVSCASELRKDEVAELLRDCLEEITFHRRHLEFLEKAGSHLQESGVIAA